MIIWWDLHPPKQQFTSEANPRDAGQLLAVSQIRFVWHSLLESQSPSSTAQGLLVVQKCSSPTVGAWQQSTSESKSSETGQLLDPHTRPSWHSSWDSQSPSFSEQVWQLQNPISPLLAVPQLTKERVL